MARVFISYKRTALKQQIESVIGEPCWMEMKGIESDAQFVNDIMRAINEATIFLFMYSHNHSALPDSEKEYDRLMAFNTIKLVKKLGWKLVK